MPLPKDAAARKAVPIATGCLDYFPDALAAVADVSRVGNEQHNPGEPLHWARGKSNDQADALLRHLVERGTIDTDGVRHSAKVAWRALALLQLEIEAAQDDEDSYVSPGPDIGGVMSKDQIAALRHEIHVSEGPEGKRALNEHRWHCAVCSPAGEVRKDLMERYYDAGL